MSLSESERALLAQWQQEVAVDRPDEVEQVLRELGVNPTQRHKLRRSGRSDHHRGGRGKQPR